MTIHRIEELTKIVDSFSKISGATISIFDSNCQTLVGSHPGLPFCSTIRKIPAINEKCFRCDAMGFSKCSATKKPYLYHCHMGLVEIVAPIMLGETLLGYILIGQFIDKANMSDIYNRAIDLSIKYQFDANDLLNKLEKISYLNEEYTNALIQLIEMCANYIWLKNIMGMTSSNIAYEIRLYISEHLTEDLSVDFLCSKYGISATALYQLLKKTFGVGIAHVIKEERIKKAVELLSDHSLSIGDIAALVGLPDANYFTRFFKAETNMTPTLYRKKLWNPESTS